MDVRPIYKNRTNAIGSKFRAADPGTIRVMNEVPMKCSICGNPITEPTRTNAAGEPVHDECVVKKLVDTFRQRDPSSKRAS